MFARLDHDAKVEAKERAAARKPPEFDNRTLLPKNKNYDFKMICLTLAQDDFEKAKRYYEEYPFSEIFEAYALFLTKRYSPR